MGDQGHISQFDCGQLLLDVTRMTVEDPHQGLFVEMRDLVLDRVDILDLVAVGESEIGNRSAGWRVVEERVYLSRDHATTCGQHAVKQARSPR